LITPNSNADDVHSEGNHPMTIAEWLEAACADAERRGLPQLAPILETLARSTERLRTESDRQRESIEDTRHQ
jgi:hypothetical protein